jgi:hypothetical protein
MLKTTSAGAADQSIIFATYPTDKNNEPLPAGVIKQYTKPEREADRFWEIYATKTDKPNFEIQLYYTPQDIDPSNNPKIREQKLKLVSYNINSSSSNPWRDMKPAGEQSGNSVLAKSMDKKDLNKYWAIVDAIFKYYIPNVITPNGDGHNDLFGIVAPDDELKDTKDLGFEGDIKEINAKVFDRWGKEMKSWTGTGEEQLAYGTGSQTGNYIGGTWDGTNKGNNKVSDGTYFYTFELKDDMEQTHKYQGTVTVINNK